MILGPTADCTDLSKCIGVQLPYGTVRDGLNLQDNPGNLGKAVLLKGDVLKYSGVAGLKTVTEYKFVDGSSDNGTGGDDNSSSTTTDSYLGNFNSFNNGEALSSPYGTYTNATGWTAENCILLGGSSDASASNPFFTFIGATGVIAPTLNGKTTALGSITSPTLTGGIKTLSFNYGFAFTESKCQFKVTVKDASGNVVKEDTVTLDTITKATALSYSLDVNHTGDFTIKIENTGYSGATGNKDRLSIWNLTWTK
jgi:hypothetical protein